MRILIYMLPELGHLNPTFPLAAALANRGHDVVYLCTSDLAKVAIRRGYRAVITHRDTYSAGTAAELDRLEPVARQIAEVARYRALYRDFVTGRVDADVQDIDPDVVVADTLPGWMILLAHRLELPVVPLSVLVTGLRFREHPPLSSDLLPGASPLALAAAYASHGCLHARRGPLANPSAMVFRSEVAATRFGYPHAHIAFESATVASYPLYREAVVSASALDFPSSRDDGPIYLGIPVELDRDEDVPEALAGFVDPRRPLVYASLGSQTGRYLEEARVFDAVLGAAANHPDWKVVLCAGERRLDAVSRAAPPNVLVLRWAPQLWLLERAAVFVTHAGLGGIREAVQAHVPMIAIPQGYDQPGNAARVEYHGIGVRVPAVEVSAPVLDSLIERILRGSDGMRRRLEQLDRACQAEAAEQRGVHVIEAAARRRPRAPAARPPAPSPRPATPSPSNDRRLGWLLSNGAAALDAGAERHAPPGVPLGVFVGGFTIATDLTEALRLATGPLLARVALAGEVIDVPPHRVGRTLRCVWTLDLTEVLYDHAAWCAEITVPVSRRSFVRERIGRHRALIASGATDQAAAMARTLLTDANWYDHGEAGAACAMFGGPVVAAQNTTVYAADVWALGRVGDAAGTRAGAAVFDAARIEFVRTLEDELERRVAAYALARGLALDPPPPP